ncbi:MAG: DUF4410 domain-containing protein [Acidobacteriota bacterium]
MQWNQRIVILVGVSLLMATLGSVTVDAGSGKTIGKNPGKIKGRWLRVESVEALKEAKGVYIGDLVSDIQWKRAENEAPLDEELLDEYFHDQLSMNLKSTSFFGEYLESAPAEGAEGIVRLDCKIEVEPGSRTARYLVGFGAGKSRSILELTLIDHATGEELGLYHGYGVGSGMGFKLVGGTARKMTQDDIQENTKRFIELLDQL